MKKNIFILIILACYTLSSRAYDLEEWNVYYNITGPGEVEVTQGEKAYEGFVNIPDSVVTAGTVYRVTAIGDRAFMLCDRLTSLRLPTSLKRIGTAAFASCRLLSFLRLPAGTTIIGDEAFLGCSGLVSVNIPASVKEIGTEAFARCTRMERINVDENSQWFAMVDNCLYNKEKTTLLAYPNAHGSQFMVPQGTRDIAPRAFEGCTALQSVMLPPSVTAIGDAAFYGCTALTSAQLSQGLVTIGKWAFAECENLPTIRIPAQTATIGEDAFSFCSNMTAIYVDEANSHFCSEGGVLLDARQATVVCFPCGKDGSYRIPSTVTAVNNHAFYGCTKLQTLIIPASVAELKDNPFVFCDALTDIVVEDANARFASVDGILFNKAKDDIVFFPNGREGSYTIPENITEVKRAPFMMSHALSALTLPSSARTIESQAFLGCYGLTAVNIPYGLTQIGEQAFDDCANLRDIICCGLPVPSAPFASESYANATLYVPRGAASTFMGNGEWGQFGNVQEFGIYIPYMSVASGADFWLPLMKMNTLPLSRVEADITLPAGITVRTGDDGSIMVNLGGNGDTHTATCQHVGDQTYRLTITPNGTEPLDDDPTVCVVAMTCSSTLPLGPVEFGTDHTTIDIAHPAIKATAVQQGATFSINIADPLGITFAETDRLAWPADIYNLQGIRVKANAYNLKGLPGGIYLVNGHKVVVK